jgi:hypothetical protein
MNGFPGTRLLEANGDAFAVHDRTWPTVACLLDAAYEVAVRKHGNARRRR